MKLSNVFIKNRTEGGSIYKIGDFGLAIKGKGGQANFQSVVGTGFYIAPEIGFSQSYTNKVDMWALGVMFYRMLFGDYPYDPSKLRQFKFDYKKCRSRFPSITNTALEILIGLL